MVYIGDSDEPINQVNSVNDGMYPHMSTLLVRKSIEDEKKRMSTGELVLVHAILHMLLMFLTLNVNMLALEKRVINLKDKMAHIMNKRLCGINLAVEFLDELKRQDKYDDSVIVIFGDHGNGTTGLLKNRFF